MMSFIQIGTLPTESRPESTLVKLMPDHSLRCEGKARIWIVRAVFNSAVLILKAAFASASVAETKAAFSRAGQAPFMRYADGAYAPGAVTLTVTTVETEPAVMVM